MTSVKPFDELSEFAQYAVVTCSTGVIDRILDAQTDDDLKIDLIINGIPVDFELFIDALVDEYDRNVAIQAEKLFFKDIGESIGNFLGAMSLLESKLEQLGIDFAEEVSRKLKAK